ncbi:MAG: sigma-70 family RNA polymerase sigma factor, partial [Candidatus Gastranaerophilales bacterium]|nr:sigma-70 family RNA polymerase sigma factor [Candidatus Gastranaerophilales bacterium]
NEIILFMYESTPNGAQQKITRYDISSGELTEIYRGEIMGGYKDSEISTKDIFAIDTYNGEIHLLMHRYSENRMHSFIKKLDKEGNILSEEKIDTFLNCFNRALSIEQGANLTDNKELTLAEIIEDEKQNVERSVIDIELKKDIKRALDILKEKEKNVITLRFGLDNSQKKTLEEIGESYGVTKECIRQIEKRALNKIAQDEFYKNCLISYIK